MEAVLCILGFPSIPDLYQVDCSASPLHPLLTRCDDKTFSRHCPVFLEGQKHHLHHWLHADFTSMAYLVRTPDRRGSELCTGAVTAKRVMLFCLHGASVWQGRKVSRLWGDPGMGVMLGSWQKSGIPWTCYSEDM